MELIIINKYFINILLLKGVVQSISYKIKFSIMIR